MSPAIERRAGANATTRAHELGDFTTDAQLLVLVPMAAVIGVIAALVARALVWLIAVITNLAYYHRFSETLVSPAANQLGVWAVLVPVVGGLAIGILARFGSEKIRGHGIPEAMEAILIGRSRMDAKVAILKPIASAIAIGTGGPFGAEGPIIMTGGALGSLFAQAFHLTASERKTLLVAGAAAGMSAIFATPLAAVLIAVELLLFEWKPRSFVPVATAAVVAAVIRIPLFGHGPLFPVAPHSPLGWPELLYCLALGVVAGLGSAVLTGMVYAAEDGFAKLPLHWMWWPMIGGLVVGIGGLVEPRALGVGYDTISDLLRGNVGMVVVGLLVAKALIWSIALGSGTSGGVLAPLLIMGGALGAACAHALHASDPGLWAMISMAAMMGGTMRSPLTAVAFVIELTHDIALLPALLVGCVVAHALTVLVMKRSILTEKVARRGYHVTREYSVSPFARHMVKEVMERNVATLPADLLVDDVLRRVLYQDQVLGEQNSWPVVDEAGKLVGLVTRGDLIRAIDATDGNSKLLEIGTRSLVVTYPDELLEHAVQRMARAGVGRLPVVDRRDRTRLIGMLDRKAMAEAYLAGLDEEQVRETGETSQMVRDAARRLRKGRNAGADEDESSKLTG
jgi:H+/Cl- antiporter ClcA/predicted transcriptional regulator